MGPVAGMANQIPIMVVAMVIAVGVMLFAAGPLGAFVGRHPSVKMLALSFLLLIGVMLVVEGTGRHIEKGYIYFAMAFSVFVELLNMRYRNVPAPAAPHHPFEHAMLKADGLGAATSAAAVRPSTQSAPSSQPQPGPGPGAG